MSKKTTIRAKSIPTKRTLNLVIKEKSEFRPELLLPAVLIVLVIAAVFGKFAVLDRYAALAEAEDLLAQDRHHLEELRASYADFDEVQAEYNRYTYTDFDRTIRDRQDVLDLLEKYVFPVSGTQQLRITDNSVSLTLTGMTLEEVATLSEKLKADTRVDNVIINTTSYAAQEETGPVASMMIMLSSAVETPAAAAADSEGVSIHE